MSTQTTVRADACSVSSRAASEPLAGSAPIARGWIVVEEPGPWGRDALRDSSIDPQIADAATELAQQAGVRIIAARHRSRRRLALDAGRNVWLATCSPDSSEVIHAHVASLTEILQWDLAAIGDGVLPEVGNPVTERLEFICTHSGRDTCCAVHGRARADARSDTWECSHLGGHRFAATSLVLPDGVLFGRLNATEPLTIEHMRGASRLDSALQVAEIAVRRYAGWDPFVPLWTDHTDSVEDRDDVVATVRDGSGRRFQVTCVARSVTRRASCQQVAQRAIVWEAVHVEEGH